MQVNMKLLDYILKEKKEEIWLIPMTKADTLKKNPKSNLTT